MRKAGTDEERGQLLDDGKLLDCTGHLENADHLELGLIHSALLTITISHSASIIKICQIFV